jgi:hypothetical protein
MFVDNNKHGYLTLHLKEHMFHQYLIKNELKNLHQVKQT